MEILDGAGKFWIMVPARPHPGSGQNQVSAVIHAPASADRPIKIQAEGINITPNILTQPETTVTLYAEAGIALGDRNVQFTLGDQDSISYPLGISVLKRDTVNVTVHFMAYENPNSTSPLDKKIGTDLNFTKENIEEKLNNVYGLQTNTFFEVTVRGALTPKLVTNWDNQFPAGDKHQRSGNGKLDLFGGYTDTVDKTPGLEGEKFVAASEDKNADINIWIIATPNGLGHVLNDDSPVSTDINSNTRGVGFPTTRQAFINGISLDNILVTDQEAYLEEELQDLLRVIAHEVGHVILGAGHPGRSQSYEFGGASPLPDAGNSLRLMFSPNILENFEGAERGEVLVKKEWDQTKKMGC